jgi:hypothetical protein
MAVSVVIEQSPASESVEKRRSSVLDSISNGIEDDYLECKREWILNRSDLTSQIKFIKIIAGMANLLRSREAYFVVGADIANKKFQDVANLTDFDPAKVDDLLRKFLNPQPAIQIHELDNGTGGRFVLFVIAPSQRRPITISKASNSDSTSIREGEVWIKSGTITRLATRSELDQMYEERMEAETETRARQRFSHFRDELDFPTATKQSDRPINKSLIFGPREVLRTFLTNAFAEKKYSHISVLTEMMRDILLMEKAVRQRGASQNQWKSGEVQSQEDKELSLYLTNEIEPALVGLTEIGLMCIKHRAEIEILAEVLSVAQEYFDLISSLGQHRSDVPPQSVIHPWRSLAQVYATVRTIAVYAISRERFSYLGAAHNLSVHVYRENANPSERKKMLLFFPIELYTPQPELANGVIEFSWHSWISVRFSNYFYDHENFVRAALFHEVLLELNSFSGLGYSNMSLPMTKIVVKDSSSWVYYPEFKHYQVTAVGKAVLKVIKLIQTNSAFLPDVVAEPILHNAQLIRSNFTQVTDRFIYSIQAGARLGSVPTHWHFDNWFGSQTELTDSARRGYEEEKSLENRSN